MIILGIEAAAKCCSAALYKDGNIVSMVMSNAGMTHSQTLMPMVDKVFHLSSLPPEEVDYIALTKGPGSFTGLRIGAATAKGLALGLNKPLIPVGTLEALTYSLALPGVVRVATMDARRQQVYAACYVLEEEEGHLVEKTLVEPDTLSIEELYEKLAKIPGKLVFMGDAADLYEAFFKEKLGDRYVKASAQQKDLSAASVCCLAAQMVKEGFTGISSKELTLEYLRKPQAEREREARLKAMNEAKSTEAPLAEEKQ